MKNNTIILFGSILMFIAIGIGAFGAHAWQNTLNQYATEDVFATASQYHFIHALALLWLGIYGKVMNSKMTVVASVMIIGTLVFSGSLYCLSLTGIRWLGAITPIGGVLFLISWGMIIWTLIKKQKEPA